MTSSSGVKGFALSAHPESAAVANRPVIKKSRLEFFLQSLPPQLQLMILVFILLRVIFHPLLQFRITDPVSRRTQMFSVYFYQGAIRSKHFYSIVLLFLS